MVTQVYVATLDFLSKLEILAWIKIVTLTVEKFVLQKNLAVATLIRD